MSHVEFRKCGECLVTYKEKKQFYKTYTKINRILGITSFICVVLSIVLFFSTKDCTECTTLAIVSGSFFTLYLILDISGYWIKDYLLKRDYKNSNRLKIGIDAWFYRIDFLVSEVFPRLGLWKQDKITVRLYDFSIRYNYSIRKYVESKDSCKMWICLNKKEKHILKKRKDIILDILDSLRNELLLEEEIKVSVKKLYKVFKYMIDTTLSENNVEIAYFFQLIEQRNSEARERSLERLRIINNI